MNDESAQPRKYWYDRLINLFAFGWSLAVFGTYIVLKIQEIMPKLAEILGK